MEEIRRGKSPGLVHSSLLAQIFHRFSKQNIFSEYKAVYIQSLSRYIQSEYVVSLYVLKINIKISVLFLRIHTLDLRFYIVIGDT